MYYKLICILYALLCGQNFILVKVGVTIPLGMKVQASILCKSVSLRSLHSLSLIV
jgi:hypothetical protein